MSRPSKKEFKLGDDDGSTNAFIEGVAKSAPMKDKPADTHMEVDRGNEPWSSDIYSRLQGGSERSSPKHNFFSVMVFGFSLILIAAAIALVAVASFEKSKRLLPICPDCKKMIIGLYIMGAIVIAIGILGIIAAKTRHKGLAIPFTVLLVLVAFFFLAITVVVVILHSDINALHLKNAWKSAVKKEPENICHLQGQMRCSGFGVCCNGHDENGTAPNSTTPISNVTTTLLPTTTVNVSAFAANVTTTVVPTTTAANSTTTAPNLTTTAPNVTATTAPTVTTAAPTVTTTAPNVTTTAPNVTTTAVPPRPRPPGNCYVAVDGVIPANVREVCAAKCRRTNHFEVTCDSVLQSDIKKNLALILGILIPWTLIVFIFSACSIRMTKKSRYYDEQ